MSKRKRKLQQDNNLNQKNNQPPKKKTRYNEPPKKNQPPKCPNPYTPPKRNPSQTNGLSRASRASRTSEEYVDTPSKSNKPKRSTKTKKHLRSQNIRKSVPSLRESQASLAPSAPIRQYQYIPPQNIRNTKAINTGTTTTTTTITSTITGTTAKKTPPSHDVRVQVKKAAKRGRFLQKTYRKTVIENKQQNTFDLMDFKRSFSDTGWLVILITFAISFALCYAAMTFIYPTTSGYIEKNESCFCDVKTNKTCIECKDCMDEYWAIYEVHSECIKDKQELQNEIDELKQKMSGFNECDKAEKELKECKVKNEELKQEIMNILSTSKCAVELETIGELEHELGECNVEWGSCELLGELKNSLDKKRVEEIEKQKQKFSFCNQQLKRYKEKAKENKGNK